MGMKMESSFIFNRPQSNEESMESFERKLKSKEIFEISFASADLEGNLIKIFQEGKVQLNNEDINGRKYDPKRRAAMLAHSYHVVVKSIDKENSIVYVSYYDAKASAHDSLTSIIEKGIKENEPAHVKAYITRLQGTKGQGHAMINLGGVGIEGIIGLGDWSVAFTSDIRLVAKEGDVVEVKVVGKQRWNGKDVYKCSRKLALDFNPWEKIEEKFPAGSIVNLKCVSLREKNFFGCIDGLKEINAYCEYPDNPNIRIVEGIGYQGIVSKVSEQTKLLRVRIFKALN